MITSSIRAASMSSAAALARVAEDRAVAPRPGLFAEAGVDHEDPLGRFRHPEEEIERHRAVVNVAEDEILGRRTAELGVFDREQLVGGR
jgi:esterase/lipase superfamily enzyme